MTAAVTLAVVAALTWASRDALNVDGVAYLDLAALVRSEGISAVVQGYWSPLYPLLLAIATAPAGGEPAAAIRLAHLLNGVIAVAGVGLLWRWSSGGRSRWVAPAACTAFLLASARAPRLDAVTPDLLLLVLLIGATLELLRPEGPRSLRLGLWLGVAFLAKTSTWPWMLGTAALALAATGRDREARRRIGRTVTATAAVGLVWLVPLSVHHGGPWIGDAGSLNACWYLRQCSGRSPDTHRGTHRAYGVVELGDGRRLRLATLDASLGTYAPWSDPSAWQQGIGTERQSSPAITALVAYWGRQAGATLAYWLPHLLAVLVALAAITRPVTGGAGSRWRGAPGFVLAGGILGILQFIAVHAEPRLIAPFVMMAALGVVAVTLDPDRSTPRGTRSLIGTVALLGLASAVLRALLWLGDLDRVSLEAERRAVRLATTRPAGVAADQPLPVAVLGPAFPMMPDLYRRRAVVVVHLFDPPPAEVTGWPPEAQGAVARAAIDAGARELWISRAADRYGIVPLEAVTRP